MQCGTEFLSVIQGVRTLRQSWRVDGNFVVVKRPS